MSRVGKKPIPISDKVNITYNDKVLTVKGDKGALSRSIHDAVDLKIGDDAINIVIAKETKQNLALQGMTRSLVANMVAGVETGFERVLEINGIGYRAELKGNTIVLNLGYSHPINYELPDGISATVEKNNVIKLSSIDKEKLGLAAATIRRFRPPEPYKGKGVKYAEEYVRRKAGKTGTK